jgi:hypothetical protein
VSNIRVITISFSDGRGIGLTPLLIKVYQKREALFKASFFSGIINRINLILLNTMKLDVTE